ncbi:MAG: glycosyltransferase family 4 protein [Kiloniellaceae bacterium]
MKIAYVTMQFPVPSEAFAAVEIRALRRHDAEITVLACRGAVANAGAMLSERSLQDLQVDHGGLGAGLRGLLRMVQRPADSLWLITTIFRHCGHQPLHLLKALVQVPRSVDLLLRLEALRPDVVHLFWGHYPSLVGLLVKRRLPGVVVSQFLGAYDLERRFPLSGLMAQQADLLLTHAKANRPAFAALGLPGERVQVAYRGIEITAQLPAPEKVRGLMVIAERLVPQKCTEDAIRVFAAVRRDLPHAQLVVCGMGPESARLQHLSEALGLGACVRFAGHVPHSEILALLSRAEVALTMSRSSSERLPNVMKEAMLRRCLCLSSRTAGIEELIDDGETGLIVDLGDVDTAANRLRTLLADPAAVTGIGNRAQAQIVASFDVDRLMAERLQIWSALRRGDRAGAAA